MDWLQLLDWAEAHQGAASWFQAVFSVLAILAAVGTFYRQQSNERRRIRELEREELRVILEGIQSEVTTLWDQFDSFVGKAISESESGPVGWMIVHSDRTFPVYQALVPRIALVKNPPLRTMIFGTYAQASSLLKSFDLLNQMNERAEKLTYELSRAATAPTGASPLEIQDVLASPDLLAVGLSEYDAVSRYLQYTKDVRNRVAQQIKDDVGELRGHVEKVNSALSLELAKSAR
ncbi:hypothetical protein RBI14_22430 [Alcaligenaceae bacterium B3P038]|nr:hypothetical protein [Alcaligenaceae bacterium B3P038]